MLQENTKYVPTEKKIHSETLYTAYSLYYIPCLPNKNTTATNIGTSVYRSNKNHNLAGPGQDSIMIWGKPRRLTLQIERDSRQSRASTTLSTAAA